MAAALDSLVVPGRMNRYEGGGVHVLVDCMHNRASSQAPADGPEAGLSRRAHHRGHRHRRGRSPQRIQGMGEMCGKYADRIFFTTDNPDFDDPGDIASRLPTPPPRAAPPGHHSAGPHPGRGAGHSGGPGRRRHRPGRKGQRRHPAGPGDMSITTPTRWWPNAPWPCGKRSSKSKPPAKPEVLIQHVSDPLLSPHESRGPFDMLKAPDFLRNQELFGGDCWTRTSDLLRVKQAL